MTKEEQKAYDMYAAAALQALIAKFPLTDQEGEFGDKKEDMRSIKGQMARSAHEYAWLMMCYREEYAMYNQSPQAAEMVVE